MVLNLLIQKSRRRASTLWIEIFIVSLSGESLAILKSSNIETSGFALVTQAQDVFPTTSVIFFTGIHMSC